MFPTGCSGELGRLHILVTESLARVACLCYMCCMLMDTSVESIQNDMMEWDVNPHSDRSGSSHVHKSDLWQVLVDWVLFAFVVDTLAPNNLGSSFTLAQVFQAKSSISKPGYVSRVRVVLQKKRLDAYDASDERRDQQRLVLQTLRRCVTWISNATGGDPPLAAKERR